MKKLDQVKALYKLLESVHNSAKVDTLMGMCAEVDIPTGVLFSHAEKGYLRELILDHRPENFSQQITHPYYWPISQLAPRVRWIKERIEEIGIDYDPRYPVEFTTYAEAGDFKNVNPRDTSKCSGARMFKRAVEEAGFSIGTISWICQEGYLRKAWDRGDEKEYESRVGGRVRDLMPEEEGKIVVKGQKYLDYKPTVKIGARVTFVLVD